MASSATNQGSGDDDNDGDFARSSDDDETPNDEVIPTVVLQDGR